MRIISLSTIPPRFATLGPTLDSLVRQRAPIDEIRLHIPRHYRRFPEYDGSLPAVPDGVTIVRPEHDLGPASKVLFAAKAFRGRDAQILFCDDDKIFAPGWAGDLFGYQETRPGECVALIGKVLRPDQGIPGPHQPKAVRGSKHDLGYWARRVAHALASPAGNKSQPRPKRHAIVKAGYVDILQGLGGAVIRPDFFDDTAYDIPEVIWAVDDVWLSGLLASKGIPIWLPAGLEMPATTEANDIDSLYRATIEGTNRRGANARCVAYMRERFKVWV